MKLAEQQQKNKPGQRTEKKGALLFIHTLTMRREQYDKILTSVLILAFITILNYSRLF
jgi:hypothetical protein